MHTAPREPRAGRWCSLSSCDFCRLTFPPGTQWGCVFLFSPLAAPPCKGVRAWTEVGHLLQKYWCSIVIYSYVIQILLQYSILFNLIFLLNMQKINNWIQHGCIHQPPLLSLNGRDVESKTDRAHL